MIVVSSFDNNQDSNSTDVKGAAVKNPKPKGYENKDYARTAKMYSNLLKKLRVR